MRSVLLTELIVEHLSNRIQLVLMMSVFGMLVVGCAMGSPNCTDCDPVHELYIDNGHFPA